MVASQFYLHALTGAPPESVRNAANQMISDLDTSIQALEKQKAANTQDIVNLWCARGFAIHLLGDTYAHATLDKPSVLYDPGLGHLRDGHERHSELGTTQRIDITLS